MSIEGKLYYRDTYLKSDKWQNVRLEALVREKAKCQICQHESVSNDAHHVWYPEQIFETTPDHLVVLCRSCHDFLHVMLPDCKTRDMEVGRAEWLRFYNAILVWRASKAFLFGDSVGFDLNVLISDLSGPKLLREQLAKVVTELKSLHAKVKSYELQFGIYTQTELTSVKPPPTEPSLDLILSTITKWAKNRQSAKDVIKEVEDSDYQI